MRYISFILVLFCLSSKAQQTVLDVDKMDGSTAARNFYVVGGTPVTNVRYIKVVSGSPYFFEEKMRGKLLLYGGKTVDSLFLRLDLVTGGVLYSTTANSTQEMEATSPIAGVMLTNPTTGEVYTFTNSAAIRVTEQSIDKGWYQVLVPGKNAVYKKVTKVIRESRPYSSATYEQSISTVSTYFLFSNNAFTQVKKLSAIPEILSDKKAEMSSFIKKGAFSGKKDSDYVTIMNYYNSLQPK